MSQIVDHVTKLFIAPRLADGRDIFLLESFNRQFGADNTLFNTDLPDDFTYRHLAFVAEPAEADYILVPHGIKKLDKKTSDYLAKVRHLAKESDKKVVVFVGGDLSSGVFIDDMIVFKGSQYKHLQRVNEIIVPPFVEDLGAKYDWQIRSKSAKPVVGFCGWSDFVGLIERLKYWLKNFLIDLEVFLTRDSLRSVFKKGLFFRRRAIDLVKNSLLVDTNIIVRRTFSGNLKTASTSIDQLRIEYINNIKNSDFVLAPKGDGNFSLRFYETLAMGRIPILIDTDCALPLGRFLPYDQVMVRVPYQEINNLDVIVSGLYSSWSPEDFVAKQQAARNFFRDNLRYDSFFNLLFSKPLEFWLE